MSLTIPASGSGKENFFCENRSLTPFVISTVDNHELFKIKFLVKEWKEIASERLTASRELKHLSTSHLNNFLSDADSFSKYKEVLGFVTQAIDVAEGRSKIIKDWDEEIVVQKAESKGKIQAISVIRIHKDEIYISALASAPWNIAMYGGVSSRYTSLTTKGAGKSLVLAVYRLAKNSGKLRITTTPLAGSLGFYKHLGMHWDEAASKLSYEITPKTPDFIQTVHREFSFLPSVLEELAEEPEENNKNLLGRVSQF